MFSGQDNPWTKYW